MMPMRRAGPPKPRLRCSSHCREPTSNPALGQVAVRTNRRPRSCSPHFWRFRHGAQVDGECGVEAEVADVGEVAPEEFMAFEPAKRAYPAEPPLPFFGGGRPSWPCRPAEAEGGRSAEPASR